MEPRLFKLSNKLGGFDLQIEECQFDLPDSLKNNPQFFIILTGSNFNNFLFNGNTVNQLLTFHLLIDNTF
jgi:hypothetical protein